MKKLLSVVASTALLLGLVSCGSTGGEAKGSGKDAAAPSYTHPMTYTLDLADSATPDTITFSDNSQYGDKGKSTRQVTVDFTKLVKPNKPVVGDTIIVTGIITSPIDLDKVLVGIVDDSPAANYWTFVHKEPGEGEEADVFLEGITANEPYEINLTFEIKQKIPSNTKFSLAYGEQNGEPVTLTVERVSESNIGDMSGYVDPQHKEPKTWEIDISKDMAYIEMGAEYPWVDGQQDTMADPLLYSGRVDIIGVFPDDDKPIAGDKLHLTWKTKCNTDIAELYVRAVENTAAVPGWWKEIDVNAGVGYAFAENIVADEVNIFTIDIELAEAPIEGLTLYIWYPLEAADGSSIFTYVRD